MDRYAAHMYIRLGIGIMCFVFIPLRFILFPGNPYNYIVALIFFVSGSYLLHNVYRMHKKREAMK